MDSAETLLGEHGEGYCRTCRFIEPLDPKGRIAWHSRVGGMGWPTLCKGSGQRPGARTPFLSRLSRFSTDGVKVECLECGRFPLYLSPARIVPGHLRTLDGRRAPAGTDWRKACPGSGRRIPSS